MNMFAMGHGLHSAVRQEVRKFLYLCVSYSTIVVAHTPVLQ